MEVTISMLEFEKWLQQTIKAAEDNLGLKPDQISHILFIIARNLEESESR